MEAVGRGELEETTNIILLSKCSLRNPLRVRRKGGMSASTSKVEADKLTRKTQKCGICGTNGHNRKSCQLKRNSQTLSSDGYGI